MSFFNSLFGKNKSKKGFETFAPQPDDVKMWRATKQYAICKPCDCLNRKDDNRQDEELQLHGEKQDTNCEAWKLLEDLIATAIEKESSEFAPGLEMPPEMWSLVSHLPSSIGELKSVKRLYLYDSNLVQIPSEIGEMENLEELDIYTSCRLHWLPYEITRCHKLNKSRASTRALYGNYKHRPPFPRLGVDALTKNFASGRCSVCNCSYAWEAGLQVWISLRVAKDVFPLLVNACSKECVDRLPQPADGYVNQPHLGGLEIKQPPMGSIRPRI